jgi:hypothetical protein
MVRSAWPKASAVKASPAPCLKNCGREFLDVLFVRADNPSSLQAHRKMGMRELGTFDNEGVRYMALTYSG